MPDPEITDDGDVIVRVDTVTICGTDLHILAGDVPAVRPGRIRDITITTGLVDASSTPTLMRLVTSGQIDARRFIAEGLVAGDLMTHPAVTVGPGDTVEHAARMMYSLQVQRLPVVDAVGFVVGIVSRADLLASFDRPDEEILAEIADVVIVGRFGMDPAMVRVSVTEGAVTLEGHPEPAELGYELADTIRYARGVVAVRDELGYPPAGKSFVPGLYF